MIKEIINDFHVKNPTLPKYFGRSKAKYMKKTLELFYLKYKSINNYMKYLGYDENEIDIIKKRFVY